MQSELNLQWAELAIERIYKSSTLSEAISSTAGYITESIEEIWRMMGSEEHDRTFSHFIDWVIEGSGENSSPDFRPLWESMKEILDINEQIAGMEEWEVELVSTQRLSPYLDPSEDRLNAVWGLFRGIISCLLGWVDGTLKAVNEYRASMQSVEKDPVSSIE